MSHNPADGKPKRNVKEPRPQFTQPVGAVWSEDPAIDEWKRVLDFFPDLIAILDLSHRFVWFNKPMKKRLGVSAKEAVGMFCYECIHGLDKPPDFCPHARLLEDNREHSIEVFEKRLGGLFLVSVSPVYSRDGRLIGSIHVARDITEQKATEEALRNSQEQYKLLADHSADVIYKVDIESERYTYVSPSVERIMGYTQEEALLLKVRDTLTEDSYSKQKESLQRALESGQRNSSILELDAVRKDGHAFPVEIHANFILNGEGLPVEILGVARDISARKRVEKELERKAQFDRLVSRISSTFVELPGIEVDEEIDNALAAIGGFVGADRAYLFQFQNDSGLADNTREWCADGVEARIDNLKNISIREELPWFNEHLSKGKPFHVPSVAALPPEAGRERAHFEAQNIQSLTVVPMESGDRILGFLGFDAVRGPRVWSDEDLSLLHFVGEIFLNGLQRKRWEQQAKQMAKMESLSRMAGSIAHNFNNSLNVVTGYLELAMLELPPEGEITENLMEALRASQKAANMTRQLLTYLGRTNVARVPLDIAKTCSQSLPALKKEMEGRIALEIDFPNRGPIVKGNSDQIQQVLKNLVANAAESFEDRNGTVYIAIKSWPFSAIPQKRLPVQFQPQSISYACIEVKDTGSGIPEKDIEKIFDPFFSTRFTGRGLGLPVVLGIVREHGGAVAIESTHGKGSVFRVFFPVSEKPDPT